MNARPAKPRKPKPRWGSREHDAQVQKEREKRRSKLQYVNGVNHE